MKYLLNRLPSEKRQQELKSISYAEYLQTVEWKKIKNQFLQGKNNRCEICDKVPSLINIHHKNYTKRGHETENDLQILCVFCHRKIHNIPALKKDISIEKMTNHFLKLNQGRRFDELDIEYMKIILKNDYYPIWDSIFPNFHVTEIKFINMLFECLQIYIETENILLLDFFNQSWAIQEFKNYLIDLELLPFEFKE